MKYYRYKEFNKQSIKYIKAESQENALTMLSFLVDESDYGSIEETWLSLELFEEIHSYEIPDRAAILYESYKNRKCISGTSEDQTFETGNDSGWTKRYLSLKSNLFYVLPFRVFVIANSEEAARNKLFPLTAIIDKMERNAERHKDTDKDLSYLHQTTKRSHITIIPFFNDITDIERARQVIPDASIVIETPTLEYDRWYNYITGYLFRRIEHQKIITEELFEKIISKGLLASYDELNQLFPSIKELCEYQDYNSIEFEFITYPYNNSPRGSLKKYLKKRDALLNVYKDINGFYGIISTTGEKIFFDDKVIEYFYQNQFWRIEDYDVKNVKVGYRFYHLITFAHEMPPSYNIYNPAHVFFFTPYEFDELP